MKTAVATRGTAALGCVVGLFLAAALAGCNSNCPSMMCYDDQPQICADSWMTARPFEEAISDGVIAQHTIFPHHFEPDCADFTQLGRRDLAILAEHYRKCPGQLIVRRGPISQKLYEARVQAVRQCLASGGVSVDQMAFTDGLPGGDGIATEHILRMLVQEWGPAPFIWTNDTTLPDLSSPPPANGMGVSSTTGAKK